LGKGLLSGTWKSFEKLFHGLVFDNFVPLFACKQSSDNELASSSALDKNSCPTKAYTKAKAYSPYKPV
jgi:hypothetical protein